MDVSAWIRLTRPWNAAVAAAAVWLGWASLHLRPEWPLAFWGSLSMLLLVAAGNLHNDTLDVATDRVNRPTRPLASGRVRVGAARLAALLLLAGALLAAWIGSPLHGILAAAMAALLWAYNRLFKALPLIGNLAVALLCGLAVWFVEFPLLVDFPDARDSLPAALFAFLATLARELVKDAEDVAGDRAAGLRTLAVTAGPAAARRLALVSVALLLLLLPLPMTHFGYHWAYAVAMVVLCGPVVVLLLGELARDIADDARTQRLLKLFMLAGMFALWAGVWGR